MYIIYSTKHKKLGELDSTGELTTTNKSLQAIYDNVLTFGVFIYNTIKSGNIIQIDRQSVTSIDGDKFLEALVLNLESLGFILELSEE